MGVCVSLLVVFSWSLYALLVYVSVLLIRCWRKEIPVPETPGDSPPVYNDMAYFEGENYPRCTDTPSLNDRRKSAMLPEHVEGNWICALPDGHEDWNNPKIADHSWVRVSA